MPKRSYYHMQRAFHPQYVYTLLQRPAFAVGEEIPVPVYVVNDSRQRYEDVAVDAEVLDEQGRRTTSASFSISLAGDSEAQLVRQMRLRFSKPGTRKLRLSLRYGDQVFENEYPLIITEK